MTQERFDTTLLAILAGSTIVAALALIGIWTVAAWVASLLA